MKNIFKIALLLLILVNGAFAQSDFLWKGEFEKALADRSRFFRNYDIKRNTPQFGKWQKAQVDMIAKKITAKSKYDNVWYNYVLGLIEHRRGANNSATLFGNSLSLSKESPGKLWLLFMEFYNQGLVDWEDKSLELLHKQMIQREIESIPAVSQQLLVLAERENHRRDDLLIWAKLFDYKLTKGSVVKMSQAIPYQPSLFVRGFKEVLGQFNSLWEFQVEYYYKVLTWLSYIVSLIILSIYLYLSMVYLPVALHPFNSMLPKRIPFDNKVLLGAIIAGVVYLGGFIPFIWVITFLLWKVSNKHSKAIMAVAVLFVLVSPFEALTRSSLLHPLMGDHALKQYQLVIDEGYSPELKQRIEQEVYRDNKNYLPHLSLAIAEAKKGDFEKAMKNAFAAEYLAAKSSEVQVVLGNIHYYLGQEDKAISYYRSALEFEKDSPYALFNLSQLYQSDRRSQTEKDKAVHSRKQNPRVRNALLSNDDFFSAINTANRVVLYPSISPETFWSEIWPKYKGGWDDAKSVWGIKFLGIPPLYSFFVFLLLAGILIYKHRTKWNRVPLWATNLIEAKSAHSDVDRKEVRKVMGIFMMRRLTLHIMNIVFPGLGFLYQDRELKWSSFLLICVTSVFYTLYWIAPSWSSDYPFALTSHLYLVMFIVPIIYNLFFLFYGLGNIYNDRDYREAFDGV